MKRKGLTTMAIVAIVALILVVAVASYYSLKIMPKSGWKIIHGCVSENGKKVEYQFYGKNNWQLVTENMGCDKDYPEAQTFGLKNQSIGDQVTDVSQTTMLLFDTKPSTYDEASLTYYDVPNAENLYFELGRITMTSGDTTIGITDTEWDYLKKSFKFK